jgi:hypothetical protein
MLFWQGCSTAWLVHMLASRLVILVATWLAMNLRPNPAASAHMFLKLQDILVEMLLLLNCEYTVYLHLGNAAGCKI